MLLKRLTMKNFRQFIDTEIKFVSNETEKNVTMIIGDNGAGKTTLAQAFFWCLYGETTFSHKIVLNKKIAKNSKIDDVLIAKVELELIHGENTYTFKRIQTYKKNSSNELKVGETDFDIERLDSDGITHNEKATNRENLVESILPKALSKYFFFDGERINNMSKDISSFKKSGDFADAVRVLLGLDAIESAIEHFNPRKKGSVIRSYKRSFDSNTDDRMKTLTEKMKNSEERLYKIEKRLEEVEEQKNLACEMKKKKENEIKEYKEGERLQTERDRIEKEIEGLEKMCSREFKDICSDFNNEMQSFFSLSLISEALGMLKGQELSNRDIPSINSKTIKHLLNHGFCLCGENLKENSKAYEAVEKWLEYLPPHSISTSISNFKKDSKNILNRENNLCDKISDRIKFISENQDDIIDKQDDLQKIERRLTDEDMIEKVRNINKQINNYGEKILKYESELKNLLVEKGKVEQEFSTAENKIAEIALTDKRNRKIQIYKICAERIFEKLEEEYTKQEVNVRKKLQNKINSIFKQIYNGGLFLNIDEKYHISIYEEDFDSQIEASTGQNVSAIFAFITAIIEMARENRNSNDKNAKSLSSEPYPLVMDAPLSSFDKKRIKAGCEAIPRIADQVVIFIKDTEGELAEKYLGNKIGYKYNLIKVDESHSYLEAID